MDVLPRYSPLAWIAAVAISACGWAATMNQETLSIAAFWLATAAVVAWILIRWTARFTRRVPAGESREPAVLRAIAWLGFLLFALWTVLTLPPAIIFVYPNPAASRAYAEILGIELDSYVLLALALGVLVAANAATGLRALSATAPQCARSLQLAFVAALAGWTWLAIAQASVVDALESAGPAFGADLPSATLFVIEYGRSLGVLAVAALLLAGLAWKLRNKPVAFQRIAIAQILLLMLFSACFTFIVLAGVLPLASTCGGAV